MKKRVKVIILILMFMFLPTFLFACEKDKTIYVQEIVLSTYSVNLRPTDEPVVVVATIKPDKATNKNITFKLTDNSIVDMQVVDNYSVKITPKDVVGPFSTYLQATSEDGNAKSSVCKITVYTEKTQLFAPENLKYDNITQTVVWDEIPAASGYILSIDNGNGVEEIPCATNSYKGDAIYDSPLTVKVKSVGDDVVYTDSEFTEELKFLQLSEPENLRNEENIIYFSPVDNAEKYRLYINDNFTRDIKASTYLEENGYELDLLDDAGDFEIRVQAIASTLDDTIVRYDSTYNNSISIKRFQALSTANKDFKFTYLGKVLSWTSVLGAEEYIISQSYNNGTPVEIRLSSETTSYVLDTKETDINTLQAGNYRYKIRIVGNGKEYLNSDYSNSIQITKLASPNLKVEDGKIAWDNIEFNGGYEYLLNNVQGTVLKDKKPEISLLDNYEAGDYYIKIKTRGNGAYAIESDYSQEFKFTKLQTPATPTIEDNKYLVLRASSLIDYVEAHITFDNLVADVVLPTSYTTENIDNKEYKVYKIDISNSKYDAGNYKVYARCYGKNYLKSNSSETINFVKLNNANTSFIENGELKWTLIDNAEQVEIYVGENVLYKGSKTEFKSLNEEDLKIENFKFEANVDYSLKMKFLPESNTNFILSNISEEKTITKLAKPTYFYVEDGDFKVPQAVGGSKLKYNISSIEGESVVDSFDGQENIVYTINAFYYGENKYLSSDTTKDIKVKVLSAITTLNLENDTFSFESIGMPQYQLNFKVKDEEVNETKTLTISSNSFSLEEKIAESEIDYENINGTIIAYITYVGTTVYEDSDEIAILNRNWLKNEEKPNEVEFKILKTPKEIKVYGIKQILEGKNNGLNELCLVANLETKMFELTVTNLDTTTKTSKILTTNDYLKIIKQDSESIIYKIDTDWLDAGNYTFEVRAIEQNNMKGNVHIINSFGVCKYENAIKLSKVTNLSCENGIIEINDSDTKYQYLLLINGKIIYDDILEEGQTLIDFCSTISAETITEAMETIKEFKEKSRTLKDNYVGTFKVSAIKCSISSNVLDYIGEGVDTNVICSAPCEEIEVTRISHVNASLKSGYVQWTVLDDFATSFEVVIYNKTTNDYTKKQTITINKNDESYYSNGIYKLSLTDALSMQAGNYGVTIEPKTTLSKKLNGIKTEIIQFSILSKMNLGVFQGELIWSNVSGAKAYKLVIQKDGDTETLILDPLISSYILDEKYVSGTYTFTIKALGISKEDIENGNVEDTQFISSEVSDTFEATKLEKPTALSVSEGKLLFKTVTNGSSYSLADRNGNALEKLSYSTDYLFALNDKYSSGIYNLKYRALGNNLNLLNSDYSDLTECYKLNKTAKVMVKDGELEWDATNNFGYNLVIKQNEINSFEFNLSSCSYEISKNDGIGAGLYKVYVTAKGDSEYYLNSDAKELVNVKKLYNVENVRILNGVLTWDKINAVNSLNANESNVPSNLSVIFEKDNQFIERKLNGNEVSIVLDSNFGYGTYRVYFKNIGKDDELFTNSKEIIVSNIRKLEAPEDLNIDDGVNLKFTNKNTLYSNADKYKISITQVVENTRTIFEGILKLSSSKDLSVEFDKLYYYEIVNNITGSKTNVLVNLDDATYNDKENAYYYNGNKLLRINKEGKFYIKVLSFGDDKYINSEYSEQITVSVPEPVTNLKVEHGKITWVAGSDADKFILKITRTDLSGTIDEEFNKQNSLIRVLDGCSYNLTDVNYIYTISVKAYSIKSENENENMMASKIVEIGPITFNSFSQGNGVDIPYEINSADKFYLMRYNNKASYELTGDIELTNFTPLFTKDNPFIGSFDGNNKTIRNLTINSYFEYSGIFGYISTQKLKDIRVVNSVEIETQKEFIGTVENLVISNVNITEGMTLGAIAGVNEGVISNIQINKGSINTVSEPSVNIGATNKTVRTGSIVGINRGIIKNVVNYADILPKSKTSIYAGGICAENENGASIINCENHGKIKGNIAGGIVAINYGNILACSFTANIYISNFVSEQTSTLARAGGIAGINYEQGVITNCTVYNANFGIGSDITSWSGIIDQSEANVNTDAVLMGGLVGKNIGTCEFNIAEIELRATNSIISVQIGKMFGHNENNMVKYNYTKETTTDDAVVFANGVAINNTNKIVTSFSALEDTMNNSANTYLETINKAWILDIDNEHLILANK